MAFILDAVIVILVFMFILIGSRRGLFRCVRGLLGTVLSFIISVLLFRQLGAYLSNKFLSERIYSFVQNALQRATGGVPVETVLQDKPDLLTDFLRTCSMTFTQLQQKISQMLADGFGDASDALTHLIAEPMTTKISCALAFLLLFLVSSLLIGLLLHLIGRLLRLPVLRQADRLLGFFGGALGGILTVWILCCVFATILPYLSSAWPDVFPANLTEQTRLFKPMTNFNFFTWLLGTL